MYALQRQIKRAAGHYRRAMRAKVGSNERKRQMFEFESGIRAAFVVARGLDIPEADFTQLVWDTEPTLVAQALEQTRD